MRQYIFRGKRVSSQKWIYGSLLVVGEEAFIFPLDAPDSYDNYKVDPDTVGQMLEMEDRKTIQLYEGDIVRDYISEVNFKVVFTDYGNFGLKAINTTALKKYEYETIDPAYVSCNLRVIGNIHDNPELIS